MMRSIRAASSRIVLVNFARTSGASCESSEAFSVANDCGERRAKLVARIGDKIDPDFLSQDRCSAVDHAHEGGAVAEIPNDYAPRPTNFANARQIDLAGAAGQDVLQRIRMAEGEPDVAAFDAARGPPSPPRWRS